MIRSDCSGLNRKQQLLRGEQWELCCSKAITFNQHSSLSEWIIPGHFTTHSASTPRWLQGGALEQEEGRSGKGDAIVRERQSYVPKCLKVSGQYDSHIIGTFIFFKSAAVFKKANPLFAFLFYVVSVPQ